MDNQNKMALPLRMMAKLIATRPGGWFALNIANPIDRRLMRWTKGRIGILGPQTGLLEVRGRKSGELRTTPLAYVRDGDRVILIASKAGATKDPVWYLNLTANPDVSFIARGASRTYTARTAAGEERDRLWKLARDFYKGFDDYQARTDGRVIPVIVLDPR